MPPGRTNAETRLTFEAGLERTELRFAHGLQTRRVDSDEGMGRVARGLGPLAGGDGVLNCVRVQGQLAGQFPEEVMIWIAQIKPDERAVLLQVIRDLLQREVLDLKAAVAPEPGPDSIAVATGHVPSLPCEARTVAGARCSAVGPLLEAMRSTPYDRMS